MLNDRATMLENHGRFLRRVIEAETIWGLDTGQGFAWCESNDEDGRDVIMFWSDRAYAERLQKRGFSDCTVDSIPLFDFLFRWLPGMANDGVMAGTNWTAGLAGVENDPHELQEQLLDRMPQEMIARYRDQLRKGLDEQGEGA